MQTQTRRRSRADLIHDRLRHLIVTLELQPGQPLVEKQLCETFGVSRTPLREAILRLAEHGMVTVAPQHGTFVSVISPRAVRLAHFLRESLELPVIRRLAAQPVRRLDRAGEILLEQKILVARGDQAGFILLDDQFHQALFDIAGLPEIWDVIHSKKGHLDRVRFLQGSMRGSTLPLAQHETLLEAIDRGAVDETERLLREHLGGSLDFLERHLRERPDLFVSDPDGRSDLELPSAAP